MRGSVTAVLISAISLCGQTVPPSFQTLSRQADAARDAGQMDKALALYQQALKLRPDWDEGLWNAGSIAYDLDRYPECSPAFHRLADLKPESAPAWIMSGLCEYKLRRYDAALESLSRAEALKFDAPPELARTARLHLAIVLTKSGSFERAINILLDLTRQSKKTPEIIGVAGIAGLRQQWISSEVPEASRELVFKLGDAMASAMELDYKEATQKFEAVLQQYPQEPNVHFRFGAFLTVQDSPRGVEEIKRALELAPDHVPALVGLTVIYLKRGNLDDALEYGERAVHASPADFSTHIALGRVLLAKEDPARAAGELETAVKLAPSSPEARLSLASAYTRLGRKEDSARELAEFKRLEHLMAAAPAPPAAAAQQTAGSTVKTTVDEVLLDLIVRDKKGKPVADLKPQDITVLDNGAKQTLTSFRLVSGADALTSGGTRTVLEPLRRIRLVTLAFEAMTEADQRKLARTAALDLIHGDQGGVDVFYAVVAINTRLFVLQQFTKDKAALARAIERATGGLGGSGFASESDTIIAELKRNLGGQNGADQQGNELAAASQTASQPVNNGSDAVQAKLASVMLDILRMEAAAAAQGSRLTLSALRALVDGQRSIPGRKSVIYFTWGMYLTPELDVPFRNLMSAANRNNVTFYSVDTRGVMTGAQNSGARGQLNGAARASATDMTKVSGGVTKDEIMASDNAEVSARANVQESIRTLAESTGGFLIGDSNDLRVPLRRVNEEIGSYYEVSFNPGIQNYDGSFRKIAVNANRKDLVIQARSGYFALPPGSRDTGPQPFEETLLKALSGGTVSEDVKFRAGAVLLQPGREGSGVEVLVEVPLHELQPNAAPPKTTLEVHCSLTALVKDASGEVVQKLTRDRAFQVSPEQLKLGHFLDKFPITLPAGRYHLESAVMDRESGKIGTQHSEFVVTAATAGVAISSLVPMRSYTPNAKGLDPDDPFQFQGGGVTPTLDLSVKKGPNVVLRLFFIAYPDPAVSAAPAMEIEFLRAGQSLTKVPMQLPAADARGRIPYLMTIPTESIPAGTYEVRATARQGATTASSRTTIVIE